MTVSVDGDWDRDRDRIREYAVVHFSPKDHASRLGKLYADVLRAYGPG